MRIFLLRLNTYWLAVIAGLLLWLAWPPLPSFALIFFPFALLLFIEDRIALSTKKNKRWQVFLHLYISFFIWNFLTTYWVYYASPAAVFAWVLNSLFMILPWLGYRAVKQKWGLWPGLLSLICFWVCFEWIHFQWELAWPWLALGNVFAKFPAIVQWYEYTGVLGGTCWIWLINILIFVLFLRKKEERKQQKKIALAVLVFVPLIWSLLLYVNYKKPQGKPVEITIIQPNIDPFNEKFDEENTHRILNTMHTLAKENSNEKTDYILFPETSLPENPWLHNLSHYQSVKTLTGLTQHAPNAKIIVGADLLKLYKNTDSISSTARFDENYNFYWDLYNAALQLDSTETQLYVKSKLVPGVERMPYPKYLRFLESLAVKMDGISGSRGTQPERTLFKGGKCNVGTAICYESVFGDYMNDYVKNGADVLFIITNDGWWRNTAGYKQHLHYARLRAIETRRSIARSANTGISAFINQKGDIVNQTKWWEETAIVGQITTNNKLTFYTRFGDIIGIVSSVLTIPLLILSFIRRKKHL